ncbi:MAG: hypothetical protein C0404_00575 [Verrucomicrobia bacterium]|nr:hypothetical protein [Verrucomicrobiota bacterium]
MSDYEMRTADNSMIIGELQDDFLCMSSQAGSLRRVDMHAPIPLRARVLDELFREGTSNGSSAIRSGQGTQLIACAC